METKLCKDCGQVKPVGDFPVRNKERGWRNSYCNSCMGKRSKQWNDRNPERLAASRARWLERHPDYFKGYRAANKERINRYKRERYPLIRERERARHKVWYARKKQHTSAGSGEPSCI